MIAVSLGLELFSMRSIYIPLLSFFFFLSSSALAADYTVAWAFEAGDRSDTGKAECEYNWCLLRSKKLGLAAELSFWLGDPRQKKRTEFEVSIDGGPRCCFFSDGEPHVYRDASQPLVQLRFYEGHRRRGNEFIQNREAGILYLSFSDLK